MDVIEIKPGDFSLRQLRKIAAGAVQLKLKPATKSIVDAATEQVASVVRNNVAVYGINTGLGALASTRIDAEQLTKLQANLVLSHCVGVGNFLDDRSIRLLIALKINSLARGYSGIRYELIEALLLLFNKSAYPCIPAKGSVGASGDLAPLAHLAAVLVGEGQVRIEGEIYAAKQALQKVGLQPIVLAPKEGLALLNGTQASTALALHALFAAEDGFAAALVAGCLSVEAAAGSHVPFDDRIHEVRGHVTQRTVATVYRSLLQESEIHTSHRGCNRVQDPYSLRCQPQVMGACLAQMHYVAQVLLTEANGVSDNPLIFPGGDILSGGNFHAEPVALVADSLALCIAEIGSLSERRIALLNDQHFSGLPAFLVNTAGLNSGFMMAQVTASALVSENKSLAHPASVDSIPTSANQEDHVSMAMYAARRLHEMNENLQVVVAIELLAACQGIELRLPLKTSHRLQQVVTLLRKYIPFYATDRYFAPDIQLAKNIVKSGQLTEWLTETLFSSAID